MSIWHNDTKGLQNLTNQLVIRCQTWVCTSTFLDWLIQLDTTSHPLRDISIESS